MEMGISQLENPMQLPCRARHVQQMEHGSENPSGVRAEISAVNIIQVIVGEKKIKKIKIKMTSVKENNRIEAPGLSWAHGELTVTLLCWLPSTVLS